jgi:hypothetical protein
MGPTLLQQVALDQESLRRREIRIRDTGTIAQNLQCSAKLLVRERQF